MHKKYLLLNVKIQKFKLSKCIRIGLMSSKQLVIEEKPLSD